MRDELFLSEATAAKTDSNEPAGALKQALYLWERQSPSENRQIPTDSGPSDPAMPEPENATPLGQFDSAALRLNESADGVIEDRLKRHAGRLAALERVIPGDRRLDSPRFSLMMLNAFLGRAVSDGAVLARLPGLFSIADRINAELADLELEYPAALEILQSEPDPTPVLLRDEMRSLFGELKSMQKAQQRQLVASLSALHTAISDMRSQLPGRHAAHDAAVSQSNAEPHIKADEIAQPLIDPERLVDPRPVLAAARAAASQANAEIEHRSSGKEEKKTDAGSDQRSYRSILLGSAFLGLLMILFGRDAVQFLTSSHGYPAPAQP